MTNPRMAQFLAKAARTEHGFLAISRMDRRIADMAEDGGYGEVISLTTFAINDRGRASTGDSDV